MSKIIQLESSVYNKISAGEVVERPRSVVKELLENSIDAGATNITVSIIDGGKTRIEVSDNGSGISGNYIKEAFLPHATSKIRTSDDLDTISTLGFRGEALASISAVSKVELLTRHIDESIGSRVEYTDGMLLNIDAADRANGATFVISELFYNTPARLKFLRSNRSEQQEITQTVTELILANPDISIEYNIDDNTVFKSSGRGLSDAIFTIYGKSICDKLIPVDKQYGNFHISGYVSIPELTKPNRSYQTTILNGRVITNSTISAAVSKAYDTGIMKRAFPIYIIDILMPFNEVDVNVHPNKTNVRFSDSAAIFKAVYVSVLKALSAHNKVFSASSLLKNDLNENTQVDNSSYYGQIDTTSNNSSSVNSQPNINISSVSSYGSSASKPDIITPSNSNNKFDFSKYNSIKVSANDVSTLDNVMSDVVGYSSGTLAQGMTIQEIEDASKYDYLAHIELEDRLNNNSSNDSIELTINSTMQSDFLNNNELNTNTTKPSIIGQIFNSYLIVSSGQDIYLIDQHAAHERLIYDDLVLALDNASITIQPMLIPQIIELSASDFDYIMSIQDDMAAIGLDIGEFGNNTIKISSYPSVLGEFKLSKFINNVLSTRSRATGANVKEALKERLTIEACRAAVKAGDKLNEFQINSLLSLMKDNLPLQCPHGRPAIIAFNRKDIDKLFKRIL